MDEDYGWAYGWANRDTYLLAKWIYDHEDNYKWIKKHARSLLKMNKKPLIATLKHNLIITEPIRWSKIRIIEIKKDAIQKAHLLQGHHSFSITG